MQRRELLAVMTGGVIACSSPARARQTGGPLARIGYLGSVEKDSDVVSAFLQGLRERDFREGRNFELMLIDYATSGGSLAEKAAALVSAKPVLVVADGSEAVLRAVHEQSVDVPTVVVAVNYDPVARGYAASIAHPGGNVTGVYSQSLAVVAKQLELLHELAPDERRVAVLWGAETADEFAAAQIAATRLGLELRGLKLGDPPYDLEAAFRTLAEGSPKMVLVLSTPYFVPHRPQITALALKYRLPAMFRFPSYVDVGGLMSYGVDAPAMRRRAAVYVAQILGGAKPADLPIEQADRFEFVINARTADKLGLAVPASLRARADKVIE
jgi:ABC-type uncharacterized transport system substrate-binding protein